MAKDKNKLAQMIADEDKGIIAHEETNPDAPIYYNDRINVLDDLESQKLNTWDKVKKYMRRLYSVSDPLFFVSHKENEITGKPQQIEEHRKNIVLSAKLKKKNPFNPDEFRFTYNFFDENLNRRDSGFEDEIYSRWFWIYRIIDDEKEYILFSERKLNPQLYRFRGMKIVLKDSSEISKTLKFKSQTNIFIAVEEEKAIKNLGKGDLIKHMQDLRKKYKLSKEKFEEYLFFHEEQNRIYLHTKNYTKLMTSFLFSGKHEGYPLHLIIFGPTGTGKTIMAECIFPKYREEKGIFEAANSTIKGLIPAYREKPMSIGYILSCVRIGWIDELFKMIERYDTGIYLTYLRDVFGSLNMLLEHKDRNIASGTDGVRAEATAKLIFTTNPYKKKKTIYEHVELMGATTMSRMLGLVIDMEERELIHKQKTKINKNEMMTKEEFLTIFDSCQEFLVNYEEEKVRKIYQKSLDLTKSSMREVWKARGLHHSILILDGLVKYRCLFEEDKTFRALKKDYDELEEVLAYVISSWDCSLREWESGDVLA